MEFIKNHWLLFVLVIVAAIIYTIWLIIKRNDLNMKKWEVFVVSIIGTIYATFSPILFAWIEVGFDLSRAANFRIFGPALFDFFYFAAVLLIKKTSFRKGMDIFALTVPVSLFFGRANCLIQGCCYGVLIEGTSFRVPIREIELLYYVIFLVIFLPKVYKEETNGEIYPLFLTSFGAVRFIIEFFREQYLPGEGMWHLAHLWSAIAFLGGTVWYLINKFCFKHNTMEGMQTND